MLIDPAHMWLVVAVRHRELVADAAEYRRARLARMARRTVPGDCSATTST